MRNTSTTGGTTEGSGSSAAAALERRPLPRLTGLGVANCLGEVRLGV